MGMVCIYCGGGTSVHNSRLQKSHNQVWRRRGCTRCGAIFSTIEAADLGKALSVKKDDTLEPFQRDKLFLSVYNACRHREHACEDAGGLVETIIAQILHETAAGIVATEKLAATAGAILRRFDQAAAVQYDAFHPQKIGE